MAALSRRWPVHTVLIWHLRLLKLLPFFRVPDARVVLFLHGIEAWEHQGWVNRGFLRQVDLFLSNSDFTWQQFVRANPLFRSAPHQTVHLGIGAPLKVSLPAPAPTPIALMISRLVKGEDYKGHREIINAWPKIVERVPGAELWIVGEGDLRGELEGMAARIGVQSKVRFWGRVSEERKEEMLAECRCFLLPSRGEGFGLVYLEAMRMGRPCLVSTVDAGSEVVNPPEAGLAVDLTHVDQLVEAICQLLEPGPRWGEWSAKARLRYEAGFTAEHFQTRLISTLYPLIVSQSDCDGLSMRSFAP